VQAHARAAIAQIAILGVEMDDAEYFDDARDLMQLGGQRCRDEGVQLLPSLYIEA
jgi:hypothetical protein